MEMVKFEVDIAFDGENIGEMLEKLGKAVPSAYVRVLELVGPGGGWPVIEVMMPKSDIRKFAEWYDEDEVEFWEEALVPYAKAL